MAFLGTLAAFVRAFGWETAFRFAPKATWALFRMRFPPPDEDDFAGRFGSRTDKPALLPPATGRARGAGMDWFCVFRGADEGMTGAGSCPLSPKPSASAASSSLSRRIFPCSFPWSGRSAPACE